MVQSGADKAQHHGKPPLRLSVGVLTASDTRNQQTDASGKLVREMLAAAGHQVSYYAVVPDDPQAIRKAVSEQLPKLAALIVTGGTGISARDSTPEALAPLFDKELPGFGELFRMLSYAEVGPAAFLSRAIAGVSGGRLLVALPGSPRACRLALEKLVLPELSHAAQLLELPCR
jgi:molybdenum cofactor biosynthesis protein B